MSWAFCGTNATTGEEMGYSVSGVCHAPSCAAEIDHGLGYVCGGMHEGGEYGCGYYFCEKHLLTADPDGKAVGLCLSCVEKLGDAAYHEEAELAES